MPDYLQGSGIGTVQEQYLESRTDPAQSQGHEKACIGRGTCRILQAFGTSDRHAQDLESLSQRLKLRR
jgi:hypothetical protein